MPLLVVNMCLLSLQQRLQSASGLRVPQFLRLLWPVARPSTEVTNYRHVESLQALVLFHSMQWLHMNLDFGRSRFNVLDFFVRRTENSFKTTLQLMRSEMTNSHQ